jgi:hypothetical protein
MIIDLRIRPFLPNKMETENRNNKKQENKILPEIYNK